MRTFVVVMFFIANIFTNIIVCQGILNAQKMKSQDIVYISAPKTIVYHISDISNSLPPEIQPETEEKHEKCKSSANGSNSLEDLHNYENLDLLLQVFQQKHAQFLATALIQYFEITLPPPKLNA